VVLDAAVDGGVQRFVHLSSIVTFGFDFEGEVDERTPVRPNGVHYEDTKIASEQVVLAAHADGQVPCTIVRPGDVYGPGSRPWTTEPVQRLKSGQFALPAGGRGLHSPVYVDDLVEGVVRAAAVPEAAGGIFTVTGAEPVTIGEFLAYYCRMLGIDPPRSVPAPVARAVAGAIDAVQRLRGARNEVTPAAIDYLMRRGTYSIARAREVLGYEPAVDLEEGMRRTEAWLRAEGLV
jgi:nucleoside-diphosphate-sugar epimerase